MKWNSNGGVSILMTKTKVLATIYGSAYRISNKKMVGTMFLSQEASNKELGISDSNLTSNIKEIIMCYWLLQGYE